MNAAESPTQRKQLRSVAAVAEILQMSERHTRRLIADGTLRAVQFGRVYRVPDDAIDELLSNLAVKPGAKAEEAARQSQPRKVGGRMAAV